MPAAVIAAAAAAFWFIKPQPLLRIVGSRALTRTGYRKVWDEGGGMDQRLLTDGQRVMFQENRFSDENDYSITSPHVSALLPHWLHDGTQIAFVDEQAGPTWKIFLVSAQGGKPQRNAQLEPTLNGSDFGLPTENTLRSVEFLALP